MTLPALLQSAEVAERVAYAGMLVWLVLSETQEPAELRRRKGDSCLWRAISANVSVVEQMCLSRCA